MRRIDEDKAISRFKSSNELYDKYVGPEGCPEREVLDEKARAWYYGEILRDKRKELKLTQQQLAEKVGAQRSYIARIEQGNTDIQLSSFLRIAKALGLQIYLN